VRWSGGNFLCLVADDGEDGSALVGACDLTLLPAGGPKRSREGLVADVPTELNLPEDTHFLYLTGMVVPATYRRRGIGQALLLRCEAMAGKIEPAPACVALHVDKNNTGARKLYAGAGFTYVGWSEGDDSDPSRTSEDTGGLPWRLPFGKKKAKTEVLMVKWTPRGG
jgi:ribosomal protein S18 acetylase RimI-like enzyme